MILSDNASCLFDVKACYTALSGGFAITGYTILTSFNVQYRYLGRLSA